MVQDTFADLTCVLIFCMGVQEADSSEEVSRVDNYIDLLMVDERPAPAGASLSAPGPADSRRPIKS